MELKGWGRPRRQCNCFEFVYILLKGSRHSHRLCLLVRLSVFLCYVCVCSLKATLVVVQCMGLCSVCVSRITA